MAGAEGLDDPQSQQSWLDVLLRSTAWVELPTTPTVNKKAHQSGLFYLWQGQKDSNPRPMVLETSTLPTELYPYWSG